MCNFWPNWRPQICNCLQALGDPAQIGAQHLTSFVQCWFKKFFSVMNLKMWNLTHRLLGQSSMQKSTAGLSLTDIQVGRGDPYRFFSGFVNVWPETHSLLLWCWYPNTSLRIKQAASRDAPEKSPENRWQWLLIQTLHSPRVPLRNIHLISYAEALPLAAVNFPEE